MPIIILNKTYIGEYKKLGYCINDILGKALDNYKKYSGSRSRQEFSIEDAKNYETFTRKYTVFDINDDDYIYIKKHFQIKGLQKECIMEISELVNNSLKLYLPIYKRNIIKEKFAEKLNTVFILDLLERLHFNINDVEMDKKRGRVYFYTTCSNCRMERFYFSLDQIRKRVFVGCFNKRCVYYNRNAVDIIGFFRKEYNLTYEEAIEKLAIYAEIDINTRAS